MSSSFPRTFSFRPPALTARHLGPASPEREIAEAYIGDIFRRHYAAEVRSFAPNLMLLERDERIAAAAGWRGAGDAPLFLETYLDAPIERAISRLAGKPVERARIAEVGHLAADGRGGSIAVIFTLAAHLDRQGFEWVVFTATSDLIGIFRRLGLPPLALAVADPRRLGEEARGWGSYYATEPVVVAGRIRLALERGRGDD